jgi:antitoxin (DNA-binding transcriptional repressor) of toxin-antitoxin stability system
MKTANAQEVPLHWPEILRWIADGEEVHLTERDQVIARVLPAQPVATPDFLGRAKKIWGENPPGQSLSALVSDARGGEE